MSNDVQEGDPPEAVEVESSTSQGKDQPGDSAPVWEETELQPGTFAAIQARSSPNPKSDIVEKMVADLKRGDTVPRVDVYQDRETGERYSPDCKHRSAAFEILGRPVPVRLTVVPNAKAMAEAAALKANAKNTGGRSRADIRYCVNQAITVHGLTTPKSIAEAVDVSIPYARKELMKHNAETGGGYDEMNDAQPPLSASSQAEKKLENVLKTLDSMDKGEPSDYACFAILEIGEHLKRLKKLFEKPSCFDVDVLEEFKTRHNLKNEQVGIFFGVNASTISRWLGKKATPSQKATKSLMDITQLTSEQIHNFLEGTDRE